eukprot:XP_019928262.1 PREDICTED: 78 kDa glucose-regulated protein-like [Crassostrea gigas]
MIGSGFLRFLLSMLAIPFYDEDETGLIIGIDLGTTYSCVGVFKDGQVGIIPNEQGNLITPSYVAFNTNGERLIGDSAKMQVTSNPNNTIFDVKRFIGRDWEDLLVQNYIKYYPFKIIKKNNKPYVQVSIGKKERVFAPEEISAMVLGKMKELAEDYLQTDVNKAVITVPAYFNHAQRQATIDAATIAGFDVQRLIKKPTAAAIAYGLHKDDGEKTVLVFSLGGSNVDVSLLTIEKELIEVVTTSGKTHLGGEDFDKRVMNYLIEKHRKNTGINIRYNTHAMQKLRQEVERAKRTLSYQHETRIEIEAVENRKVSSYTLTRAMFEKLNMDLFQSTLHPIKLVLRDSWMNVSDVDEIILVGGSTRIPKIQQLVQEFFDGKEPRHDFKLDESVAYGAAVQGALLSGDDKVSYVQVIDVTPITLGIKTEDGTMKTIFPRNSVIPNIKYDTYQTKADYQTSGVIEVYEGEMSLAKENQLLGTFTMTDLRSFPKMVVMMNVTFRIDANGIFTMTPIHKFEKTRIKIKIDRKRISQEKIYRMIKDAETFASEDKRLKKIADAKNDLEYFSYSLK